MPIFNYMLFNSSNQIWIYPYSEDDYWFLKINFPVLFAESPARIETKSFFEKTN